MKDLFLCQRDRVFAARMAWHFKTGLGTRCSHSAARGREIAECAAEMWLCGFDEVQLFSDLEACLAVAEERKALGR